MAQSYTSICNPADELHSLLRPYLLVRRKTEVLRDLPRRSEVVLEHGISPLQAKLYRAILTKDTGTHNQFTQLAVMW